MTIKAGGTMQAVAKMDEERAIARRDDGAGALAMIERFVLDPNVDVDKLGKLLEMQERMLASRAKADFWAAFAEMQAELPEIAERGQILNRGVLQSTYAKFEDIVAVLKPILQQHGFALSFRTDFSTGCSVTAVLAHRGGHSEQTTFTAPADNSGAKNAIQGIGSAQSYGMRYTTIALLNLTTRGMDDDGGRTGRKGADAPDGFDGWLADMEALADDGTAALQAAWSRSGLDLRKHLTDTDPQRWEQIKAAAARKGN